MTILTAAIVAALAAQSAFAEQRANKPFNTANGRTTTGGPDAPPRVITVTKPGGGTAANSGPALSNTPDAMAAQALGMAGGMGGGGGQAIAGGGRRGVMRVSGGSRRGGGKAFWGNRKADGDNIPAPAPAPTEEAPPHFSKPGALIRTTGQAPVYEKAETARTHTVDAGAIVLSKHKMFDVGKAPSVQVGPKDTLPPPNPVSGGGGYGTGATANSGPSTGSGNNGNGNNNGHNNNGSGNNDKDKPGDDFDDHGGGNPKDLVGDSINAAF